MITTVLDTNILVSFLFWNNDRLNSLIEYFFRHERIIYSDETFSELSDVVFRKKFDKYLSVHSRETFLNLFNDIAYHIEITKSVDVCRDKKDNKFLELASSGNADLIITGDSDLLELHPFNGIAIKQPSALYQLFSSQ